MLELITPNFELMKNPFNWFIVGFVLLIMLVACHFLVGKNISKDN